MEKGNLSVQRYLSASCTECGDRQQFRIVGSDVDSAVAVFGCHECDSEIRVDLQPAGGDGD